LQIEGLSVLADIRPAVKQADQLAIGMLFGQIDWRNSILFFVLTSVNPFRELLRCWS